MNEMTIQEYISRQRSEIRPRLIEMQALIHSAAPQAEERISWSMPTFYHKGNLVHFAAHANHMGFYPGPEAIEALIGELEGFTHSKGAVQFPYSQPLPEAWIRRVVEFRMAENERLRQEKKKK